MEHVILLFLATRIIHLVLLNTVPQFCLMLFQQLCYYQWTVVSKSIGCNCPITEQEYQRLQACIGLQSKDIMLYISNMIPHDGKYIYVIQQRVCRSAMDLVVYVNKQMHTKQESCSPVSVELRQLHLRSTCVPNSSECCRIIQACLY